MSFRKNSPSNPPTGVAPSMTGYARSDSQHSEPYANDFPPASGVGQGSVQGTPAERAGAYSATGVSVQPTPTEAVGRGPVSTVQVGSAPQQTAAYGVHPDGVEAFTAAGKPLGEIVVELRGVTKQYRMIGSDTEIVSALKSINLCDGMPNAFPPIRRGEFVMIRGPSGGGKTTLLNMIGTIDCPSDGVIKILGSEVDSKSDDDFLSDLRLKHIGFVFQTFNLIPTMTALENVELPMTLLGNLSEKERTSRAKQLLGLVGLRNRIHHLPSELSGGEQQRVTIARSLANNPAVLLLDEPTGDLDTSTTIEVMDLLLNINNMAGTTMVMVTHNPDVECYADRILYVNDGMFAQQAINAAPCPLVLSEYEAYLKRAEQQNTHAMISAAAAARDATSAPARRGGDAAVPPAERNTPITVSPLVGPQSPATVAPATAAASTKPPIGREEARRHEDDAHESKSLL